MAFLVLVGMGIVTWGVSWVVFKIWRLEAALRDQSKQIEGVRADLDDRILGP